MKTGAPLPLLLTYGPRGRGSKQAEPRGAGRSLTDDQSAGGRGAAGVEEEDDRWEVKTATGDFLGGSSILGTVGGARLGEARATTVDLSGDAIRTHLGGGESGWKCDCVRQQTELALLPSTEENSRGS